VLKVHRSTVATLVGLTRTLPYLAQTQKTMCVDEWVHILKSCLP